MTTVFAPKARMYIGGQWIDSGESRPVIDPGTGSAFAEATIGGQAEARAAISAARAAFDSGPWRKWTVTARADLLRRVADDIAGRNLELITLDCQNVGTPIRQGHDHLGLVPSVFRYYADMIEGQATRGPEAVGPNGSVVEREPVGVVAAIAPWNYPLWMASSKVSAAIAAGCTVVLKPSSLTPLSAAELALAFERAGAPDGVFNVVLGPASTVGEVLTSSPDVDKVSFTGGTESGMAVARSAFGQDGAGQVQRQVKRVGLELGGKSPNIVFADANFEQAVAGAMTAIFVNQGEVCSAGSRLVVDRRIQAELEDRLVSATRALRVGYQLDPATEIGPLISAEHLDEVASAVEHAVADGARLLTGGHRATVAGHDGGFYFEPTIFSGVRPDMRIAQDEIFGPVLAIQSFTDEAEAIELANDTRYGLAAGIWSEDEDRWRRVAREVRAGVVFINSYHSATIEVPWGGVGMSGMGRELGSAGLDSFSEAKSIVQVAR
jgi:betaine-aldehyde dehydrogenase